MYKVLFQPHNREIQVDDGENILRSAMEAGVHINASCGGEGVCGKCRVVVEQGSVEGGVTEKLSQEDVEKGYRIACKTLVKGDLVVRIPTESTVDASSLNKHSSARRTAHIKYIDFNELKEKGLFVPPVEKKYVELPHPDKEDNLPDVTRLIDFMNQELEEHQLQITLPAIRKMPDILRESDFKITVTLERPVREKGKTRIINVQPGDTSGRNYAVAMDIGTTTVYGQLVDLATGEVLSQYGFFNGQISYGEDVISRIIYSEKPGGLEKLNEVVINTINNVIIKITEKAGIDPEDVSAITFAGNTTMTQFMLRITSRYIRRAPYVPASTLYPPIRAADLGIKIHNNVTALVYPQISSYVGGDIVAGVMGSGMYLSEKLTLYIDIGTNAEIVVGNKDWMLCAACSAGPAFEGGGIKFGIRASKGAIEDFSIDNESCEPMVVTIGNVRPKGICGSGLITMIAEMLEAGIINNNGKFNQQIDTPRIRKVDDVYEYVIAWKDETQIDRDVVLTEIDIDNLVRAKGAIYSGFNTLLEKVGLVIGDIEHVILAGGFGSYIDLEKAMTIGLLPEVDHKLVTYVGNGSLMGAKMSSLTNRIRRDVVDVIKKMTNVELSEEPSFMDNYVAALFLPHTDVGLFPKLKKRMESRSLNCRS